MANGPDRPKTPTPQEMAAWESSVKRIQGIYTEIYKLKEDTSDLKSLVSDANSLAAVYNQILQTKMAQAEAEGRIVSAADRQNLILQSEKEAIQEQLRLVTMTASVRERKLQNLEKQEQKLRQARSDAAKAHGEEAAEVQRVDERINANLQQRASLEATNLDLKQKDRDLTIQQLTNEARLRDAKLKTNQAASNMMSTFLGIDSKWRDTFTGQAGQMLQASMKVDGVMKGMGSGLAAVTRSLNQTLSAGNILGSTVMKIQEMTIKTIVEVDKSEVALMRATGASQEFANNLDRAFKDDAIKQMAGSYSELSQLQSTLFAQVKSFHKAGPEMVQSLTRLGMAAKRSGVDFSDFARVIDKSTRVIGVNGPQMMAQLINSAKNMGETPTKVVKDFIGNLNTLAQYSGPAAIQVFRELSAISKQTGINMGQLVSVAQQFDTFDSAAQSVGHLNAIMGGAYFNTLQLLNAEEGQRLMILRQGFDAMNRTWESLGRFEKKAIAAAAGFKELGVAAAFFKGDMEAVRVYQDKQAQVADGQRRLIELAPTLVTMTEKISRAMMMFGDAAKPLLPYFQGFVNILTRFNPIVVLLVASVTKLGFSLAAMGMKAKMTAVALQNTAAAASAARTASLGLTLGIGGLALAFGTLFLVMNEEDSPPNYTKLGIFGSGAQQASVGVERLAKSLPAATSALRDTVGPLGEVSDKQEKMSRSAAMANQGFNALGRTSEMNRKNLHAFASATEKVSTALTGVKVTNARALSSLATAFSQVSTSPLDKLVTSLRTVSEALNNIDLKKAQTFASTMSTIRSIALSAKTPTITSVTAMMRVLTGSSATVHASAAAASGARTQSTADAIRVVREKQSIPGGHNKIVRDQGVLVTGDLVFSMGDDVQFRRKTADVVRDEFRRRGRV